MSQSDKIEKFIKTIKETLDKWEPELKECRDALIDPPISPPNVPYRMVVELDFLLFEAMRYMEKQHETNQQSA